MALPADRLLGHDSGRDSDPFDWTLGAPFKTTPCNSRSLVNGVHLPDRNSRIAASVHGEISDAVSCCRRDIRAGWRVPTFLDGF